MEATDSGSVEKEQTEEVDNSLESTETVSDENIEEMPEAEMENNMAGFSISGYTYESGVFRLVEPYHKNQCYGS